jgi:hypothetical protein
VPDPSPLEIARSGGKHAGFLKLRQKKDRASLATEAARLRRRAAEHAEKIADRISYNKVSDDPAIQAQADAGRTRHLQREADNFPEQAEICEELAQAGGATP